MHVRVANVSVKYLRRREHVRARTLTRIRLAVRLDVQRSLRRGSAARGQREERSRVQMVRECVSFRRPRNNAQRTDRLFSPFLLLSARNLPRRKTRKFSERERDACVRVYEPLIVRTFLGQGSWIFFLTRETIRGEARMCFSVLTFSPIFHPRRHFTGHPRTIYCGATRFL